MAVTTQRFWAVMVDNGDGPYWAVIDLGDGGEEYSTWTTQEDAQKDADRLNADPMARMGR